MHINAQHAMLIIIVSNNLMETLLDNVFAMKDIMMIIADFVVQIFGKSK